MSYILGLLFTYSRYKHDAVVRIYADDHLIDELCLSNNINLKAFNYKNMPILEGKMESIRDNYGEFSPVLFLPEKLFLFEIEEKYLNCTVRIEVENNHNNYTNGFMTKYAYVNFHLVFLIPKFLMKLENWQLLQERLDKHKGTKQYWPPYRIPVEDLIVKCSSKDWTEDFLLHPRGGSFTIDFPLYRKHKIAHLVKPKPGRAYVGKNIGEILCAFKLLNTTT